MKPLSISRGVVCACLLTSMLIALGVSTSISAADPDPDRYIVSFQDTTRGKAALKAAGARVVLDLPGRGAAAAHIPSRALQGLLKNPNIEYIEKDALRYPMAQTTPWGIPAVQADLLTEGSDRTICIIDSGYTADHEDLPQGGNVTGTNDSRSGEWDDDSCYHGTHVAGTIAALSNNGAGVVGVLPEGKVGLHIVKVFDGEDCDWTYSSSLVAALDDCIANGANVVSMSLGGRFSSRTERQAFGSAYNESNVLSIAAAGNDGNKRKSYPASYDSVVSVAAVDSALEIADFSQQNDQVELAAPGVAVRSTVGIDAGLEESLEVGGTFYEATGMEFSAKASTSGTLFRCDAVDGLGSPGDCAGADGQVCLISRGDITFAEKVQECAEAGGVAAVIYNNGDALFSGTLGSVATFIPSVGISGIDGNNLVAGLFATVTVDVGNYAFYDGTSMATPHVSGVAALVWSQDTTCTANEIRSALTGTALDLGVGGRDTAYGYGLVQASAASDAILGLNPADPDLSLMCGAGGGGGGGGEDPPPPQQCDLLSKGDKCSANSECCSGNCKGKNGSKTCK